MTPLSYLSVARFHGHEASDFLQAQLSADIAALQPGEATFACHCSVRGQVFGLLLVHRREDDFLVAGASVLLSGMLNRLKMYVFRTKVGFSEQPELAVFGVAPGEEEPEIGATRPDSTDLAYGFTDRVEDKETAAAGFRAIEISRGITWLAEETTEKFIPQMLGFDRLGAVSFTKGCYPGQEIVARARYLGKVKRGPVIVLTGEQLDVQAADRVELRREGAWSNGTVVDTAPAEGGEGSWCFIIAPVEPETAPDELKVGERTYRCATT